jgi:hypothetical protein
MSVTSSTEIANLALDLLSAGTVQDIENPTNATESLLNRWYAQSRRKVLREHPWNFATKRAQLAASSTAPAFGYSAQFPMPSDFIRLLTLEGDTGQMLSPVSYEVEDGAILINSDSGILRMRYIYDIEDVTKFDPMFVDLLAHEIALVAAFKVTESNTNIDRLAQIHRQRAAMAKAIDGQERPPTRREVSRNRAARRYGLATNSDRIIF